MNTSDGVQDKSGEKKNPNLLGQEGNYSGDSPVGLSSSLSTKRNTPFPSAAPLFKSSRKLCYLVKSLREAPHCYICVSFFKRKLFIFWKMQIMAGVVTTGRENDVRAHLFFMNCSCFLVYKYVAYFFLDNGAGRFVKFF